MRLKVSEWENYGPNTFSRSANNPNWDTWKMAPCPGGANSGTCFMTQPEGYAQKALNAGYTLHSNGNKPQGVLIHLAADAGRCLAEDGSPTLKVTACDATDLGQLWTVNAFGDSAGRFGPFRSARGKCIEQPIQPAPAKVVSCGSPNSLDYAWFVQRPGHIGTATTRRTYLTYDDDTKIVSFTLFANDLSKITPVWGFGPYPKQLDEALQK